MSSSRSVETLAASRTYRLRNLKRAHIYIDVIELSDCPGEVQRAAESLTGYREASPVEHPSEHDVRLCKQIKTLQGAVENRWMDFSKRSLFDDLLHCSGAAYCSDQVWEVPMEILAGELSPLSMPKPDLAIGVLVADGDDSVNMVYHAATYDGVRDIDLINIQIAHRIHPWPSTGIPDLAYPAIIYECESDTSPIYYAENQAAGAAAKALRMLNELATVGSDSNAVLPVIVLCSSGFNWRVFIAFEHTNSSGRQTHLVRIWSGEIVERDKMKQLRKIICRIRDWFSVSHKAAVVSLVTSITTQCMV